MVVVGVKLGDLISRKSISFEFLAGKTVAIDAFNALYQFLAIIRTGPGVPLKDKHGRITSHLNGLLFRTVRLMEYGIKPVYVFDGKPPELKKATIEERKERKEEALREYQEAILRGDFETAWSKAVQTATLSESMANDAKTLLDFMGVPWIQAPSEGEAQAAYMTIKGDIWASASQDYDSLLFGAERLVRNLTISGRRFYRKKKVSVKLNPELVVLEEALSELGLKREQLVDLAILIGTDYNEGIKGIGPKTAYKLIRKYGSLENIIKYENVSLDFDYEAVRSIFLNPEVTDDYDLRWGSVDERGIIKFLCEDRDFNVERVRKAVERLRKASVAFRQTTLF